MEGDARGAVAVIAWDRSVPLPWGQQRPRSEARNFLSRQPAVPVDKGVPCQLLMDSFAFVAQTAPELSAKVSECAPVNEPRSIWWSSR
jgi:hypothetical protein